MIGIETTDDNSAFVDRCLQHSFNPTRTLPLRHHHLLDFQVQYTSDLNYLCFSIYIVAVGVGMGVWFDLFSSFVLTRVNDPSDKQTKSQKNK